MDITIKIINFPEEEFKQGYVEHLKSLKEDFGVEIPAYINRDVVIDFNRCKDADFTEGVFDLLGSAMSCEATLIYAEKEK